MKRRTAGTCTVCSSPWREKAEELMALGNSLRAIESELGLSKSALSRHRAKQHDVIKAVPHGPPEAGHAETARQDGETAEMTHEDAPKPSRPSHDRLPAVSSKEGQSGLTRAQMRALDALVKGQTYRQAAEAAGFTVRTLYNLRRDNKAFREFLLAAKSAQDEVFEKRLAICSGNAVAALQELIEQPVQKGADVKSRSALGLVNAQTRLVTASKTRRLDVNVDPAPMITLPANTRLPWMAPPLPKAGSEEMRSFVYEEQKRLGQPVGEIVDAEVAEVD